MNALIPPRFFPITTPMQQIPEHPYRVVITSAGGRYAWVALVKAFGGSMPCRLKSPLVEEVLMRVQVYSPPGAPVGVCMPERPRRENVATVRDREVFEMYERLDALAGAPAEA